MADILQFPPVVLKPKEKHGTIGMSIICDCELCTKAAQSRKHKPRKGHSDNEG